MTTEDSRTTKRVEAINKLIEFEQQVIKAISKEDLRRIAKEVVISVKLVSTAETIMRGGTIINSDFQKKYLLEKIEDDIDSYDTIGDASVSMLLNIEHLKGVFKHKESDKFL